MTQKTVIRWCFIGLLLLLAAQFYFARRVSEPYPAVIFPGFTSVPVHQGYPYEYEHVQVVGYTATDSALLTLDEMLAPVPFKAKVFYPNMLRKIKEIVPTSPDHKPNANEQALVRYLQRNLRTSAN